MLIMARSVALLFGRCLGVSLAICSCLACSDQEEAQSGTLSDLDSIPNSSPTDFSEDAPYTSTFGPGAVECSVDEDCRLDLSQWTVPFVTRQFTSSRCTHLSANPTPVCECNLLITPTAETGRKPFDGVLHLGLRSQSNGCDITGRPQTCLYCASEFQGCNVEDADSCTAACQEAIGRQEVEFSESIPIVERSSICTEDFQCRHLWELDETCYVGNPTTRWLAPVDCAESDEALLAMASSPAVSPTEAMVSDMGLLSSTSPAPPSPCEELASVVCQSAENCPAGLACNEGVCGACADQCSYPIGQPELGVCDGDARCATGELCAMGTCVLKQNLECRFFSQCGSGRSCVISGLYTGSGRGNETTRAYCRSDSEGCPEPVFDDDGNRQMLPNTPVGCP